MGVPRCHCDKKIYPNFPSINFTKCQCSPDLVTKSQDSFPAKCQEAPLQKVHLPKEPWIQMLLWTPMLQLAKMEKYHKRGSNGFCQGFIWKGHGSQGWSYATSWSLRSW